MASTTAADSDRRGRRARLAIILGFTALAVVCTVVVAAVGRQQVNERVDDLRDAASAARLESVPVAEFAYGSDPDPFSEAVGEQVTSIHQRSDNTWCATFEVAALLSSETINFEIDETGQLTEIATCP